MPFTYFQLEQQLKAIPSEWEIETKFTKQKSLIHKWLKRNLDKTDHKLKRLHETLDKNQQWQKVAHEGILLQAHLYRWEKGSAKIIVEDWEENGAEKEIHLDPSLSASEEIQKRLRSSKKLQLSLPHLAREIKACEILRNSQAKQLEQFEIVSTSEELDKFIVQLTLQQVAKVPKNHLTKKAKARSPYHEFWSASGLRIWVGKKAVDNDKLTFSLANGSDYWLHVSGFPGSHVVIKSGKNKAPDDECIEDALQLALAHSKASKGGEAEVIYTQCKFISRFGKGAPGKVQVSKHQKLHVRLSNDRLEKVKKRLPPKEHMN